MKKNYNENKKVTNSMKIEFETYAESRQWMICTAENTQ